MFKFGPFIFLKAKELRSRIKNTLIYHGANGSLSGTDIDNAVKEFLKK